MWGFLLRWYFFLVVVPSLRDAELRLWSAADAFTSAVASWWSGTPSAPPARHTVDRSAATKSDQE
jgi:hypothetical protein